MARPTFFPALPQVPVLLGVTLGLAACTSLPEVSAVEDEAVIEADFPTLVPLEGILETDPVDLPEDLPERLTGRAEALQARAQRLSGTPVIDEDAQSRMDAGLPASE